MAGYYSNQDKIMKIQDQVCTFEQAMKLKEFGISFNLGNYYWEKKVFDNPTGFGIYFHFEKPVPISAERLPNMAPAFTVAELGIMLGHGHPSWQFVDPVDGRQLFIATRISPNNPQAKEINYILSMNTYTCCDRYEKTEAQARAQLLLGYMKAEAPGFSVAEINERLKNY